ncbi:hypothetical protein BRADI_1g27854v3 [Brachypodium distachyon]|uniref:Uncharacterized protein n=1 Tax=Brachypodium distachyon TaxID=15368 RepID=A0A2K2DLG7_BRADI|nr:hypothetical protein BRADI_1g27854v3 [Brachypodium distachyon]
MDPWGGGGGVGSGLILLHTGAQARVLFGSEDLGYKRGATPSLMVPDTSRQLEATAIAVVHHTATTSLPASLRRSHSRQWARYSSACSSANRSFAAASLRCRSVHAGRAASARQLAPKWSEEDVAEPVVGGRVAGAKASAENLPAPRSVGSTSLPNTTTCFPPPPAAQSTLRGDGLSPVVVHIIELRVLGAPNGGGNGLIFNPWKSGISKLVHLPSLITRRAIKPVHNFELLVFTGSTQPVFKHPYLTRLAYVIHTPHSTHVHVLISGWLYKSILVLVHRCLKRKSFAISLSTYLK